MNQDNVTLPQVDGEKEDGIHLFAHQENPGQATVALRWCICPEVFKRIRENDYANVALLIVAIRDSHEVSRQVVPLEQMMTYISFQSPGRYKIYAILLFGNRNADVASYFLKKRYYSCYDKSTTDYKGEIMDANSLYYGQELARTKINVNVAEEFFAPEPYEWEKWWVNLWYETEPRDQCQFRRRRMLAYTVQPPAILVWITIQFVLRLVTALLVMSLGFFKDINFASIVHPFDYRWKNVIDDVETNSNWILNNKDGKYRRFAFLMWPLVPFVQMAIIAIALIVNDGLEEKQLPSLTGLNVVLATECAFAGIVFVQFLAWLFAKAFKGIRIGKTNSAWQMPSARGAKKALRAKERRIRQERELAALQERALAPLVCQGQPLAARLQDLPKEKQTIYLRYLDLKAKVCKPFRR